MDSNYIEMLKELQSKYEFEVSNQDCSNLNDIELRTLIVRKATIRSAVLPAIEFLIKESQAGSNSNQILSDVKDSKIGFSKRDIVLLVTALDHYKWYQVLSEEEKGECVRLKRILQKLYKQAK